MDLQAYVREIRTVAAKARSESKLEVEATAIVRRCLGEAGIRFDPAINETLKSLGLSQVDSHRPDGVFGHIVYDYKFPGLLSKPRELSKAKAQIEGYLNEITGGHDDNPEVCATWFAYLFDGYSFAFCRSDDRQWDWLPLVPLSENSLLLLVHAHRALRRKPLTAQQLSAAFGKESPVARQMICVMCSHLAKPKHKTNMLFREWKRLFQQVSTYGLDQLPSLRQYARGIGVTTKDASQILFAMHSYYSLVVKLLTSELLAASINAPSVCYALATAATQAELYSCLCSLEDSAHYRRYRISNFLEGDFFSWYVGEKSKPLANAIRDVAHEFLDFEPATRYFRPGTIKDLLKEFYSGLVDKQIRHDLGEYYTPDWLAQHLLNRANYEGSTDVSVLDPACGSGTFLVECILRLRRVCERAGMSHLATLRTILRRIRGLDLNPLAVISARANYILAIADLVVALGDDIEIPVYLADAINVPLKKVDSDGDQYLEYMLDTEVERLSIRIPVSLVKGRILGRILLHCEDHIAQRRGRSEYLRALRNVPEISGFLDAKTEKYLCELFDTIESLEEKDWDRIWCRVLKNNFSPNGFEAFDLIVGNPPWVRWSRLPETYRTRVKWFCNHYGLVSGRGYTGGIESDISTVITYSAADNWLKPGGTIAFLITWTVFKSNSARGFRLGELPGSGGLKVRMIEDLTRVQPFPDASNQTAAYVATRVDRARQARFRHVPCYIWEPLRGARIPTSASLAEVYERVNIRKGAACPVSDWGTPWFTGDLQHYKRASFLRGRSKYTDKAHRGTISDCARVYWLKVLRSASATGRALVRTLTEEELPRARQVPVVTGAWIEADLLHPLIRGRDAGRYCSETDGWYQLIPNDHYANVAAEEEFADKYPLTYSYLKNYEDLLLQRATYRRYQTHLPFYVIYCVGEYSFSPYKVVWMEQQDPTKFRACVIASGASAGMPSRVMVPDHKLYFASFGSKDEAHYVCGVLNSAPARVWLGGFLLGKQIGTSVFEYMKVPKFDRDRPECRRIAKMSQQEHGRRDGARDRRLLDVAIETELAELVRNVCR